MKLSLLLVFTLFLSTPSTDTVGSYDWSLYKLAEKQVDEAISKIVDAHLIINDNLNLKVNLLPENTKSQLAIIQDGAFSQWLVAVDQLGEEEASKYWDQFKSPLNLKGNVVCYNVMENDMRKQKSSGFEYVKNRGQNTLTACHLNVIQEKVDILLKFYECINDKYGSHGSPLTPSPTTISPK